MFGHKLKALDYDLRNGFDLNDKLKVRNLIAWLEDQKIRHYKIEDRTGLRAVDSGRWDEAFHQYLSDIDCPFDEKQLKLALDWVLTLAVRLDYEDNLEKYQSLNAEDIRKEPQMIQKNPIDNLDFESTDFKEGVRQLARVLKVAAHPTDHLTTLRAIALLIGRRVSAKDGPQVLRNTRIEDKSTPLKASKDPVLNNSAKLLRLIYINDMRVLQTKINQIIAEVQSITANPITDTTLGKVGV